MTKVMVVDGQLERDCQVHQVGEDKAVLGPLREYITPNTEDLPQLPFSLDIEEDNLSEEQRKLLHAMLLRHVGAFSLGDDDLGYIDNVKHGIPLTDETPIRILHRQVPPNLQQEVRQHLESWMRQGIIRKSNSPWAFQAVLVRKKTGELIVCVDYPPLNLRTRKDAYPLPRIDEALEYAGTGSVDDWLESHTRRLSYVLERVRRNTDRAIHARKTRQERKTNDPGIRIGSRVFLRNHPIGRAKIQDAWKPTPYKVLSCLEGSNVYIIQPADGFGATKAVHLSCWTARKWCPTMRTLIYQVMTTR